MFGYRRKSFGTAHALLRELRANRDNLKVLSSLQHLLVDEIIRAEQKIRALKKQLSLLDEPTPDSSSDKRTAFLKGRIQGLRRANYLWRCFGDAIAFLYMDKFALKQTYYNTRNANPKQGAGFLVGKEGLQAELAALIHEHADL